MKSLTRLLIFHLNNIVTNQGVTNISKKFLTFNVVYKQTIVPIIDYAGFLLISCRQDDKNTVFRALSQKYTFGISITNKN